MEVVGIVVGCEVGAGADEKNDPKAPEKKQDSMLNQAGSPTRLSGLLGEPCPTSAALMSEKKKRSRRSRRGEGGKPLARVAHDSQTTLLITTTKNTIFSIYNSLPVYRACTKSDIISSRGRT